MSSENKPLVEITLTNLAHQASIETLFEFCIIVGKRLDIKDVDGVPLEKWFSDRKIQRMEAILILLEDADPALAAKFQKVVDDSRKRTGV